MNETVNECTTYNFVAESGMLKYVYVTGCKFYTCVFGYGLVV